MNERIKILLDCFESNVQRQILDFCSRVSKIQADVFILMARKASCFFNCLEELGLIHFNGYVTSERILDMNCEWLEGKTIIIIDDAIVSGTSINRTIDKLVKAKVASIEVHVLTVNSKWFQKDMMMSEEERSYLFPKCNVETNEKCIELCYNVVKSILLQPRPYDIDFPYYNQIEIGEEYIDFLTSREGWDSYEITSNEQKENNIFSLTIIPTEKKLRHFERLMNFSFLNRCFAKIRVYGTYHDKNKKMFSLRVVPMIVFDKIPIDEVEDIFLELVCRDFERTYLEKMFITTTSKLRLIQFYLSHKFAEFWTKGLPDVVEKNVNSKSFECRNLSFIFPEDIDKIVQEICGVNIFLKKSCIKPIVENNSSDMESVITEKDYISLETRLMEPFINKYYKKEIPCRELVLEEGKAVFENEEYEELIQRLNKGITIFDMLKNIEYASDLYDVSVRVSLFIDRAIDLGMIVPIIQISNGYVFRAYRHGEDVLFGQREEILYLKMLRDFQENSRGSKGITHISTEKMIVIFSQIGIKMEILRPYMSNFTTNPRDNNGELCKILRVKPYLKGPVAVVGDVNEHKRTKEKPYITEERKSIWFTNIFLQKNCISTDNTGLYNISEVDVSSITSKDLNAVENFAILFGELCNPNVDTGITFGDEELTKISTCLTMENLIKAIAAEINIFIKEWEYSPLTYERKTDERLLKLGKKSRVYEALNSAFMKLNAYESGEAKELIKSVRFRAPVEQNLWKTWFDDVYKDKDSEQKLNEDVAVLFEESKYLTITLLYAYNILLSIQFIEYKVYTESKRHAYIDECYAYMQTYESILNEMVIPSGYEEILSWENLKDIKSKVLEAYPKDNIKAIANNKVEECYLDALIEFLEQIIEMANCYLERVCCILGESGRISKINIYKHVLAIPFCFRTELEQDYILDIIDFCYRYTLKKIEEYRLKYSNIEELKIEYLASQNKPDIEVGDNTDIVWFVARGNGVENFLAKLALNIFYKLYRGAVFKEVYMGDIDYKHSVKKPGKHMADFICNSFYRFIETLPISTFQIKNYEPQILSIVEKKRCNRNLFLKFINVDEGAKDRYKLRNSKEIDAMCSSFVIDCYEHKFKYEPDKEASMSKKNIGIITILNEEATAVIKVLNLQEENFTMGERLYYSGHLQGDDFIHSVVMTQQVSQGEVSVVSAYNDMVRKYNPSLIFLVGIAGGITQNVDYCSVVLGRQIISYDLMKDKPDGIQRRGDVNKVNSQLIPLFQRLLNRITSNPISAAVSSKAENIHICESNIASGSAVIANELSDIREWIHNYNDKTDAVEMEAHGLSTAFYEGTLSNKHPQYGVCVIRGISDMADGKKHKVTKYRAPAAENAAIVLKELVRLLPKM